MSESAKTLRKDNIELEKQLVDESRNLDKEVQGTAQLMKEHDDIVKKYRDTVEKFEKLHEKLDAERERVDLSAIENAKESLEALSQRDQLTLKKAQSGQEVQHLTNSVTVYKKELTDLTKKYQGFITSLEKVISSQEDSLKKMGNEFKEKEDVIQKMSTDLKKKTIEVNDMHREMDQENALNINQKIHELIDTLVEIEKKRRTSQFGLENALENWSIKLKLF